MPISSCIFRKNFFSILACAAICLACSPVLLAQGFPVQPVRIVAATPPGGAADINARRLADRLSRMWKQPVVVQNLSGGAGNVAAAAIAEATPNGYSMLFVAHPVLAVNPMLYDRLPFNADRDFTPVILLSRMPHVLLTSTSLTAATVPELIALCKARPGSLNFASGGAGTSIHLAGELLMDAAGIELRHVPYRGGAPAVTALMSGEVQLLFDATATAIGNLRSGRLRGMAIASLTRSPVLPDIPTFDQSGLRGFESVIAHGILVPAKTPAALVATLNRAINETLNDPEYQKQMAEFGAELIGGPASKFSTFLAAEKTKWAALIRKKSIKAN
jgi:tripartite-type tricarboxylate transporter receptor subunit TctC